MGNINLDDLYGPRYGANGLKRALKLFQEAVDNGVQTASSRVKVVQEFLAKTKSSGVAKP